MQFEFFSSHAGHTAESPTAQRPNIKPEISAHKVACPQAKCCSRNLVTAVHSPSLWRQNILDQRVFFMCASGVKERRPVPIHIHSSIHLVTWLKGPLEIDPLLLKHHVSWGGPWLQVAQTKQISPHLPPLPAPSAMTRHQLAEGGTRVARNPHQFPMLGVSTVLLWSLCADATCQQLSVFKAIHLRVGP